MTLSINCCYKIIYDNFLDYISIDKYRNIKLLLESKTPLNKLIKCRYNVLDHILKNKLNIEDVPNIVYKNINLFYQLQLVYDKYGNHKLYNSFINKCDLNKITKYNLDNLFIMYTVTQKFKGFQEWGPGNHQNIKDNLVNHYHKHKSENWNKYLDNINLKSYQDFAITKSKIMTNKLVHTNGCKVYLSGTYDKVLIIGRLHNNKLTISSCYIMDNFVHKIKVFTDNLCWYI
jgi:hypothetical protein